MREHRILRLVSALTITAALTFSVFASTALAALPTVKVGGGTTSACTTGTTSGATPSAVSPGAVAGFKIWAKNCDTSTLSKFFLTAPGSNAYGATWFNDANPTAISSCDTTGGVLKCTFGQVTPGQTIYVTVGITTGSGPSESVAFEWSASGFVLGKNKSHGDVFEWLDSVSLNGSANFAGQFAFDNTLAVIGNGSSLGNGNKQQTAIDATGEGAIPLTVQDGPNLPDTCTGVDVVCPTTFWSEWSEVNVDNGTVFGTAFKITITFYKGPNPNQVNGVYHSWTEGPAPHEELITTRFPAGGTPPSIPSFSVEKVGLNTVLVIYSFHNGPYRGY